jgi:hypothetical protein
MLELILYQPYTVLNHDFGPHDLVTWRWHVPPDDLLEIDQKVAEFEAESISTVADLREQAKLLEDTDRLGVGILLNQIADTVEEHWLAGVVSYRLVPRQDAGSLIDVALKADHEVQVDPQEGVRILW